MPSVYFHLVGYGFGMAAFAMIYWWARPSLVVSGSDTHLKALTTVHFFRYFGLTALVPGIFNLAPLRFSQSYLLQIMAGNELIAALALVSFALLLADRVCPVLQYPRQARLSECSGPGHTSHHGREHSRPVRLDHHHRIPAGLAGQPHRDLRRALEESESMTWLMNGRRVATPASLAVADATQATTEIAQPRDGQ